MKKKLKKKVTRKKIVKAKPYIGKLYPNPYVPQWLNAPVGDIQTLANKINEIIDYLNKD